MNAFAKVSDLEPSICDAALMAGVASTLAEDLLDPEVLRNAGNEQIEQALFAIYQTQKMIDGLKAQFYAAISG